MRKIVEAKQSAKIDKMSRKERRKIVTTLLKRNNIWKIKLSMKLIVMRRFFPLGTKASSYRGAYRVPLLNLSVSMCVRVCDIEFVVLLIARAV